MEVELESVIDSGNLLILYAARIAQYARTAGLRAILSKNGEQMATIQKLHVVV